MAEDVGLTEDDRSSRRPQLSLRTLMLIVLVLAIAIGWWVDHSRLVRRVPEQSQPNLVIKIFSLENGDAQELTKALRELFPPDSTGSMHVACDARTNSIMARGTTADLKLIEAILLRLDAAE